MPLIFGVAETWPLVDDLVVAVVVLRHASHQKTVDGPWMVFDFHLHSTGELSRFLGTINVWCQVELTLFASSDGILLVLSFSKVPFDVLHDLILLGQPGLHLL